MRRHRSAGERGNRTLHTRWAAIGLLGLLAFALPALALFGDIDNDGDVDIDDINLILVAAGPTGSSVAAPADPKDLDSDGFITSTLDARIAEENCTLPLCERVDIQPTVTTTGGTTAFAENGGAVVVDAGVTTSDPDSANLQSATVTITDPAEGAAEVLAATACAGLTVTPGLNSLAITGAQPPATYQTCLQSVTYNHTSEAPTGATRTISFEVADATSTSVAATKGLTIAANDDPPVVTTTAGDTAFTEDGGAVVVDAGVTVSDVDSANLASATVTITNPQDGAAEVLAASACAGLTVTPGLNSLAITGAQPPAAYQSCLASVTYDNSSNDPDPTVRVVSFVANDGTSNSGTPTKNVTVTAVADGPVVTTTAGNTAFTEDGGPVVVDAGVTVTDVDSTNLASATVTITNPQDGAAEVLAATACAGLTVTPGLNSLAITGADTPAAYQTCLASVTYDNSSQNPGTTARTVSYVANDGTSSSAAATKTVTVGAIDDPPVVTTTAGATAFTEDGGAVVVDAGVTVTDVDSANLASATVTITNPQDGAAEVLAASACAGLTVTPGLNTLAITGALPPATYQTCLQSVTFDDSSDTPNTTARTVSFVANDGTSASGAPTKTVTVAATDDAPVVTTTAGSTAFTEGGGPVVVDAGVTVTDADSANLASATVTITNPQDGAAEVLAASACAGLTVTPGLNSLAITGALPPATYQTCLASVTYDNTTANPGATARVISFVANDGTSSSAAATKTVTVGTVDDPPVVTTSGGSSAFTEDGGAVVIDAAVTVTDVDSANLASAAVTITNPQDGAAEVLAATACAGLTVTPGLNSLAITGAQPPATYQTCLQSVTYDNTSNDPNTTARTVSFVANDGTSSSAAANKTVTVTAVDDPPVVTTTAGNTAFTEDGGPVVVDAGVTVTDVDSANLASATVTITNPQNGAAEVLAAAACAGLTVTPGLNSLAITGALPPATYQTCLQSVTYDNTSNDPGTTARTLSFVANDGTSSSTAVNKTVTVAAVNDPPVVTTTAGNTAFTEDGGPVVVDAGVTVTDADNANLASASVTITNPQDGAAEVLAATACAGLTVVPGLNSLAITGAQAPATYQTCLQSVSYDNSSNDPNATARTVRFVVNDGTINSNNGDKTVTVAAVDDPPVVTTTAGVTAFTEDGGAVVVDAGVTVTDVDSANLASATVTITNPQDGAAEVLAATACAGLTVTPGLNTLGITGAQPPATYQTCLASVTYDNSSQNPGTTARVVSFVANDSTSPSVAATKNVSVAAVNDPPVVTTTGGVTAFTEDGGPVVVDAGVTVTDADNANLASATVTITNPQDGAAEVLGASACAGLTVTPGLNTLGITGSQPPATYQTCLQSVTYNNSSEGPDPTARTVRFVVNDGAASSNNGDKSVSVTAVDDPPVVTTTGGTSSFTEDGGAVVVDAGVTVTDADSANLVSATVTITNPVNGAAEVLAATSCAGLTVTPGLNSLAITGSQPLATYQTCLASVTYDNSSDDPGSTGRIVSFVANDGTSNSVAATKTVAVTPVNDPPVVTPSGGTTAFTEDGGAVTVDAALTVTDPDNANLSSASVTIVSAPDGAAEVLGAVCGGLTVTPGLNSLAITGSATVGTYQTCLRSVTYNNTSQNPNATQRTVRFVVNDGALNSNNGDKGVSVTPVNDPPVAGADSWQTVGNTQLVVDLPALATPHVRDTTGTSSGVLDNDSDPAEGNAIAVSAIVGCADATAPFGDAPACATANGGSVVMEANGRFTYTPPAGTVTNDTFQYTVTDNGTPPGPASANGTVTIQFLERVWYVRNNSTAGGLGRSGDPFDTLVEAQTASVANDWIFVHFGDGTTTGQAAGIALKGGQRLIGEHAGLSIPQNLNGNGNPQTLFAAVPGNRPLLDNTGGGGSAVSATDVIPIEIIGLSLVGNANAIDVTHTGAFGGTGTLAIWNNVFRGAGAEGLDVNAGGTGTLTLDVQGNSWNTAGTHTGNAVDIVRTLGTLRLNLSGNTNILSSATAVNIAGGAAASTTITGFANNTVHQNTGGSGIVVTNATFDATPGGAYNQVSGGNTLVGISGNGVGGSGVLMTGVAGDLAFTDLDVFADGGAGVQVSGTGAVNTGAGTGTRVTVGAGVAIVEATGGPALDLSTMTADFQLTSLKSTTSPTTGVSLVNVADGTTVSTVSAGSGSSITGATGTAFNLDGGNATVSYAGSITNSAGKSVVVANRTADTATFTGAVTDTGTGISLTSNTGSTIAFTGALSLTTGSNTAFNATGGGTVTTTNATSTLSTTTGVALNVVNTTIGAAGLTFRSISAGTGASGPTNGIVLNNTGASGGLTVSGTGSAGSGGTIQRASGNGIALINTRSASLNWMNVTNNLGSGIRSELVTGMTLANLSVTNNSDSASNCTVANLPTCEAGIFVLNLLSSGNTISNSTVSGSFEDNIHVENRSTNNLGGLTISNCTVTDNNTASGNVGVHILSADTASATVTATGNTLHGNRTVALRGDAGDTSTLNVTFTSNNIYDGPGVNQGNQGIEVAGAGGSDVVFNISSNVVGKNGAANAPLGNTGINVSFGGTAGLGATVTGNVTGNTVHNAGAGLSGFGIRLFPGDGDSVWRVRVDNNIVTNVGLDYGIFVGSGEQTAPPSSTNVQAGVIGNNVSVLSGALDAIRVQARQLGTMCARISGNTTSVGGNGGGVCAGSANFCGLLIRQANTAVFNLETTPPPALGNLDGAQAVQEVTENNPAAATVGALVVTNFVGVAVNTCSSIP